VVVVNPVFPRHSSGASLAARRAKPGSLTSVPLAAAAPTTSPASFSTPWPGVKMVHIPYKGNAPALTDLVGGHVDPYQCLTSAMPLIKEREATRAGRDQASRAPALLA